MKLKELQIKNFRGLKGTENKIDFTDSNIIFLIGQNNVGKSTLLKAYEFFVNAKQTADIQDFYDYDTNVPIEIIGVFEKESIDENDADLSREPGWIDKWVDSNGFVSVRKKWSSVGAFTKETFNPEAKEWVPNGFGGLHTKLTKYTPEAIVISAMETEDSLEEKVNKLIQSDFIKKVREDFPEKYQAVVDQIKELQSEIVGTDQVQDLNTQLNENFNKVFADLTLKIESKEENHLKPEDAFKKNHSIKVEREGVTRKETFNQQGHGVIRQALFNFLAFLKRKNESTKKEYLLLFEEPELYLHPKVAFNLRKALYELAEDSPYQILCATHSPLMIDISKPHSSLVRVSKDGDEITKTYQVGEEVFQSDAERKQRVQMINRFNPHVCEAFYADKVLLVEGDTETIVYRDLLNRFYPDQEIFVLNTGSKNNMPFFQEILTSFRIEHYVIHDTDVRLDKNGATNSAWTLNKSIWDKVEEANDAQAGLSRRYVHTTNFERAHGIILTGKDKPIRAYEFVEKIEKDSDVSCMNWLRDIVGAQSIIHDQRFVEEQVSE